MRRGPSSSGEDCELGAGRLVGAAVRVDEEVELNSLLAAEVTGVLGLTLTDDDEAYARLFEAMPVAMQLHRVFAAEYSPPVAQEDDRRRTVAPVVSEPHLLPLVVAKDDDGELVGALGRLRILAPLGDAPRHALDGGDVAELARERPGRAGDRFHSAPVPATGARSCVRAVTIRPGGERAASKV